MQGLSDMGERMDDSVAEVAKEAADGKEVYYPCVYINSKQLPGLEKMKAGDEVELHFVATLKSATTRDTEEGIERNYDIELKQGKVVSKVSTNANEEGGRTQKMKAIGDMKPDKMAEMEDDEED